MNHSRGTWFFLLKRVKGLNANWGGQPGGPVTLVGVGVQEGRWLGGKSGKGGTSFWKC